MSDETTNKETTLETTQESLVDLITKMMKSNLTEIIEEVEKLENTSNVRSGDIKRVYNDLMKETEHLNNLIVSLETVEQLIQSKQGYTLIFGSANRKQQ